MEARKAYFMVRAEVPNASDRAKFDQWYGTHHLPLAMDKFHCEKGWRFWSRSDASVHYALYQFKDMATLRERLDSSDFKPAPARGNGPRSRRWRRLRRYEAAGTWINSLSWTSLSGVDKNLNWTASFMLSPNPMIFSVCRLSLGMNSRSMRRTAGSDKPENAR